MFTQFWWQNPSECCHLLNQEECEKLIEKLTIEHEVMRLELSSNWDSWLSVMINVMNNRVTSPDI